MSENRDLERVEHKAHQIKQQERRANSLENSLYWKLGLPECADHRSPPKPWF